MFQFDTYVGKIWILGWATRERPHTNHVTKKIYGIMSPVTNLPRNHRQLDRQKQKRGHEERRMV